jgi:hypothetical protein
MFILSEGLTRTGIADIIGRQVMRLAGRREIAMIVVIMITAAVLSAFMNNIGVAALMLPVVVEVARRTRISPSRLLMPLAYATLLGGLMTMIGTPPNLLISEAMTQNGYRPFALFDFTPIGSAIMVVGVIFIALVGRFLLPKIKSVRSKHHSQRSLRNRYKLQERTFMLRVPMDSILVGKTLSESRIGSATGLIILALTRYGRSETLPGRQTVLRGGDGILVQGRVNQFRENPWSRPRSHTPRLFLRKIQYSLVNSSGTPDFAPDLMSLSLAYIAGILFDWPTWPTCHFEQVTGYLFRERSRTLPNWTNSPISVTSVC